ncbi:hypothetical protein [Quadrisphaera sp. INWT6]|uniref:hypothetical protein n=1 Tax=Quadrisphaera sp. INWT6 TaxID=2596917 RepID=UPI0019D5E4B3|nr:hypothetical protein [Quadrisphaera sp. INWT6]
MERLRSSGLHPAAVVVNRAAGAAPGLDAERAAAAAERLRSGPGAGEAELAAARVLDLHVELVERVERERGLVDALVAGSPATATAVVPALDGDVADLGALRTVGGALAAG